MVWGTMIAWYLFLAGLSAGAFLTSVYVERKYPGRNRFLLVSRIVALIAVGIGLILLIFDAEGAVHNPPALLWLVGGFNPMSVMSWGVLILSVSAIVQFLYVIYEFVRTKDNGYARFFRKIQTPLQWIGVVASFCLAAYTGLLLGVVKTAPLWNNPLLPVLFVVSAFSAGAAATQVFGGIFAPNDTKGLMGITKIHCAFVFTEIVLLAIMLLIVSSGNPAGAESVAMMLTGKYAMQFWVFLVIGGLLIPGIVELFEIRAYNRGAHSDTLIITIVIELLVLIGGFMLRYLVVKAALPLDFLMF